MAFIHGHIHTLTASAYTIDVTSSAYGADPTGSRDSTNAIQAAINAATLTNGTIYFPLGTYKITTGLVYTAPSSGSAITFLGAAKAGRGPTGSFLKWYGAAGGIILTLKGANNSLVKNIAFDPYTNPGLGSLYIQEGNSSGGPGSSGVVIEDCHITGGNGALSYAVRLGNNNFQVSEVHIQSCSLTGGSNSVYGIVTAVGNTKNFYVEGCSISGFDYGITHGEPPSGGGSGYFTVVGCAFANQRVTDVFAQSADSTSLIGCGSEGSAKLIKYSGASNNPQAVLVQCCYFSSSAIASDDIVIEVNGQLTLIGNSLENNRTGSSEARIIVGAGGISTGSSRTSVTSIGNTYYQSSGYAPIYDSSTASVFGIRNSNYIGKSCRVFSQGDVGGIGGSLNALKAISGDSPRNMFLSITSDSEVITGISYPNIAETRRSTHKVTVSYTAFVAASTTQTRVLWTIPAKTRIVGFVMDTTTAFAGTAGTLELRLGRTSNGEHFVLTHDVKTAAVTKGLIDADFGVEFVASSLVQGGRIDWTATTPIDITLNSGTGNLGNGTITNLTQGSVDVWMITESFG